MWWWGVVVLAVVGGVPARAQHKPAPCAGGRYLVRDAPLIADSTVVGPDVVTIGDFQVAVGSGCAARPVNVRATWQGTRFRKRWWQCADIAGPVVVSALIEPTCQVMTGRLVARRAKVVRNFVATRSRCGDGIVDADAGEQCETAEDCAGVPCVDCSCGAPPASTSTTVTTVTTVSTTSVTTSSVTTSTSTTSTSTSSTSTSTSSTSTTSTLPAADLVPTVFSLPPAVGAGASVSVSWTIENQGTASARPQWSDAVYLSADETLDAGDVRVGLATQTAAVAVGGSYSRTVAMTIPNVPAGSWFAILAADAGDTLVEQRNDNNTKVVPVTVQTPDLVPTAFTAPTTASADGLLALSWTVANQGDGEARSPWTDTVYLSTDAVLDAGDTQITAPIRNSALAANGTYDKALTATLPAVPAGDYFLILRVDNGNKVYERAEDNNVATAPITIQTPDLTPIALTAPASAQKGTQISVSFTVRNQGTGAAAPSWTDRLVLSTDQTPGGTDPLLATAQQTAAVPAGGTYDVTRTVTLPSVTGDYFLVVWVDATNALYEASSANDVLVRPITITP